jgi:hypothetical protein
MILITYRCYYCRAELFDPYDNTYNDFTFNRFTYYDFTFNNFIYNDLTYDSFTYNDNTYNT